MINRQITDLRADIVWAFRMARDRYSLLRLLGDFLLSRVMRFVRLPIVNGVRRVRLKKGVTIDYRLNRADIYTIHEVWVEETYKLPLILKPDVIIDLGANIGLAGVWLASRYECSHLIAAEPSPGNACLAKVNYQMNGLSAQVFEAAIGAADGTAIFDDGPGATGGRIVSLISRLDLSSQSEHEVPILSMDTILRTLPDNCNTILLKIDIEGGEQNLLADNPAWLTRINAIVMELHPGLADDLHIISVLTNAGFIRAPFIGETSQACDYVVVFERV